MSSGEKRLNRKSRVNIIGYGKITTRMKKKYEISNRSLKLYAHGEYSNVNVANDFEDFNSFLKGTLSPISKDLLDIATIVYMADRFIAKKDEDTREFNILLPVRKKELWDNNTDLLKELIGFLIRDNVNFYFEEKEGGEEYITPKIKNEFDSVICFSGGIDSYVGTIELIEKGYQPVIVSHYSSGFLSGIQSQAYGALSRYLSRKILQCKVNISSRRITKKGRINERFKENNPNQLSRSFLFLSLASTLAYELNIDHIFLCENGILSINLPISESRLNTRTAHPIVLDMYQKLINNIFNRKITISNPFIYKTKSEILRNLDINKVDSVNDTVSCWNYWNYRMLKTKKENTTHCGYCFPCIIRRISSKNAFPFDIERKNTYVLDIFNDYPYDSYPKNIELEALFNMDDLISFAAHFLSLKEYDIQIEYPNLFINLDGINSEKIIDLYTRFAKEVIYTTKKYGNLRLKKFVESISK